MTFSQEDFRQWLESKNPKEIVGARRTETNCPISTFLKIKFKLKKVQVKISTFNLGDGWIASPNWLENFVFLVEDSDFYNISAEDALVILDRVVSLHNISG